MIASIRPRLGIFLGLLATAAAILAVLRAFAHRLLRTRQRPWDAAPAIAELDAERFELALADATLRGWRLRGSRAPRATIVAAHGWQADAGTMIEWVRPLLAAGHECIVYDALGHGNSDPSTLTSLRHFRQELLAVVRHARTPEQSSRHLVLFGHSMGGAAAILVAAEGGLGIRGLIVAGAPTDPLEITREFFDARGLPGRALVFLLRPFWQRIIGAAPATLRPVDAIRHVDVPVLILHGEADRQVSLRHAERLAAASPDARLVRFSHGGHNDLPAAPSYADAVVHFVERVVSA